MDDASACFKIASKARTDARPSAGAAHPPSRCGSLACHEIDWVGVALGYEGRTVAVEGLIFGVAASRVWPGERVTALRPKDRAKCRCFGELWSDA